MLKDKENKVFYDKLTFIYLEMPNFNKTEDELETDFDLWLYFFKHLDSLDEMPRVFMGKDEFEEAFHKASLGALSHKEHLVYEDSLKAYRDLHNVIDTSYGDGVEKGLEIGLEQGIEQGKDAERERIITRLMAQGFSREEAENFTA